MAFPNDPIMAEEALKGVDQDLKEKIVYYAKGSLPALSDNEILDAIDRCSPSRGGQPAVFGLSILSTGLKDFSATINTPLHWR